MAALGCRLNRSMQHLISNYREEDVENYEYMSLLASFMGGSI